ncbi:MAG TPA: hypothetical protein VNV66_17220 [Pilimelia sp.]|nr:hypothetical protein [Pilimelia sp.]
MTRLPLRANSYIVVRARHPAVERVGRGRAVPAASGVMPAWGTLLAMADVAELVRTMDPGRFALLALVENVAAVLGGTTRSATPVRSPCSRCTR